MASAPVSPEGVDAVLTPVLTIDGPSGAGKGTAAAAIAGRLGFHLLDSGAVYRVAALHALRNEADLSSEDSVLRAMDSLEAAFEPNGLAGVAVVLSGDDVTTQIRTERAGNAASKVACMPGVRARLLPEQRAFRQAPGLVADGRDMGTVVFPDALLKVFLTATAEERAVRRAKQLNDKGIHVTMADLVREIGERDERDASRDCSPLTPASDALVIESSSLSAAEVAQTIAGAWKMRVESAS